MRLEAMEIAHEGTPLRGFAVSPDGPGPFPAVLVMHSALGIHHQVEGTARRLAERGYLAVASDMYGPDIDFSSPAGPGAEFAALMGDPARLRARVLAWFDAMAARGDVDAGRMAAIGYCFGGMCVIELARSGADVKAVSSFHGVLKTAQPAAAGAVKAHVAAWCGDSDPHAPLADITALRKELEAAGARFSIHVFGQVEHGFTDPDAAAMARPGIRYDATADALSWAGTLALLETALAA